MLYFQTILNEKHWTTNGRMMEEGRGRQVDHVLPGRSQKRYWIIQTNERCTTATTTKKEVEEGRRKLAVSERVVVYGKQRFFDIMGDIGVTQVII